MSRKKKPKFNIGDVVVITLYGTVGKITNIKWIDNMYVYEVNSHDGLYVENTLQLFSEYEGKKFEKEWIELEYKYTFGDIVIVIGYEKDVFRIIGIRTEIWRYKNDAWEEIIYELSRVTDGEWFEAAEEDLTIVASSQTAPTFLKKLKGDKNFLAKLDVEKIKTITDYKKEENRMEFEEIVNGLLDIYNDYYMLYQQFQDDEYKVVMELVMKNLNKLLDLKKKKT